MPRRLRTGRSTGRCDCDTRCLPAARAIFARRDLDASRSKHDRILDADNLAQPSVAQRTTLGMTSTSN